MPRNHQPSRQPSDHHRRQSRASTTWLPSHPGPRTGHKCLAVLDSTSQGEVLANLLDRGVHADQATPPRPIEVEAPANAYFRSGTLSTDDTLTFRGQKISKAKDSGRFALLRATGQMPSVLGR